MKILSKNNILYCFILFFITNSPILFSQDENWINITSKDGLPSNAVTCVFKDSYGFYWIGTNNGLCKYDGYEVEKIKKSIDDNSFLIANTMINDIKQIDQYILIAFNGGVVLYDYLKDKYLSQYDTLAKLFSGKSVYTIYVLNKSLFIAAKDGLYEFNWQNKKLKKYGINNKENLNYELSSDVKILFTKNHFFIVETNFTLYEIDTLQSVIKKTYDLDEKKYRGGKDIIHYGSSIYVVFEKYGVVKFDESSLEIIGEPFVIKNKSKIISKVNCISAIKNKLFIGTDNGLYEYDPLKFSLEEVQTKEKINIKKSYNIDNNLILIDAAKGLFIIPYSIQRFNNIVPKDINKKIGNVYAIYEYSTGKILVGGEGKLFSYNIIDANIEKEYSQFFKNAVITCIFPLKEKNRFFIGTYGNGLFELDITTNKVSQIILTDDIRDVSSLYLNEDTLWIGTFESGLFKWNIKTKILNEVKHFTNYTIFSIRKGIDSNSYWISTNKGLFKVNKQGEILLQLSEKDNLLSNDLVYQIVEDSNSLYIATDNGLTIYDKHQKKSQFYYELGNSKSSTILTIYLDKENNLWMSTLNDITKMVLKNRNNPNLKLFYNYSYIDGLINYEYNQNGFCALKNGYLVYGGVNGIDIFNPFKIRPSYLSVPVYVTAFKRGGKDYPSDTNIILKKYFEIDWKQNNFQIEVKAVDPLATDKILYKYKLVGYDDEYSEPTDVHYISYTGLPGGTYKLEILATNTDGVWNIVPQYIYIKVIPPFWKTSWFIITSTILVFGGIFGFNQYRTYQIKKRNKELEEKVQERTKELANKNQEIVSSIEYAKRIQQAILPTDKYVQSVLPNAFILYMPKDIVSGDFYWVYQGTQKDQNPSVIVAAVDCTGHGVPGALMSMIGNNLLNQIVIEKNIAQPNLILNEMNKGVQAALKQGQGDIQTNDGMDASIVHLYKDGTIEWAGAYRPLIIIKVNGEVQKIDGDKYPIGGVQIDADRNFTLHTFKLEKGDTVYLFSDGYADQFGGDKGRKMMMKRFIQLLQEIHLKPIEEQKQILTQFFLHWKGNYDQVDDVLIIGITII